MDIHDILEALRPSQYRPLMKKWNKERYADIFTNPKYKHDKRGVRVFIPLDDSISDKEIPAIPEIEEFLKSIDFEILNYRNGIVRHLVKKQPIKLGKILTKYERKDLLNLFNNDPNRASIKNEYMAVISRHPYDIGGMSTNRGWTSCMNLRTGSYKRYVPIDVEQGSVVAYAVRKNDPDIKNPTCRLMIKPFIDILGSERVYFGIENSIYGTEVDGFVNAVIKWVDLVNSRHDLDEVAIFQLNPKVYNDNIYIKKHITGGDGSETENIKLVQYDHRKIKDIQNPSILVQKIAVSGHPEMLRYCDFNNEEIQLAAATNNGYTLDYLKRLGVSLSDKVIKVALANEGKAIRYVDNPSEEYQKIAVSQNLDAYRYIKNISPEIKKYVENKAMTMFLENGNLIANLPEQNKIIYTSYGDLEDIASEFGLSALKYLSKSLDSHVDIEVGEYDVGRVIDLIPSIYVDAMREYVFGSDLENGDIDQDEYDEKTITDIMNSSDDLENAINSAAYSGLESGINTEMYNDVQRWITDSPFRLATDEEKKQYNIKDEYILEFDISRLTKIILSNYDEDEESFDLEQYMNNSFKEDFDITDINEPYYGYSGFDDETAKERFFEEIPSEIDDIVKRLKAEKNKNESIVRIKKLSGL